MSNDHDQQHDVTQGENPGAQGDFGAGQGNPGDDPVVSDPEPIIEGDEQPRREEELGDDNAERTDPGAPPAQGEPAA